jgi:pullulanase/glycogen debranching enzyme
MRWTSSVLTVRLHASGIEVMLDVVYNHTAEGSEMGPDAEPARPR